MKLTAKVQLLATPEQYEMLLKTLERANEACNYLSDLAWSTKTFRQFSLHKIGYYEAKERFELSSQVVIRCEAKVADSYKLDKKTKRTFKPHGAIAYDSRILKWKLDKFSVSIWTLSGRQEILFSTGPRQLEWLKFQQGESDLVYSGGKFFLLATCEVPEPTPEDVEGYLGCDMGIVEIATTSDGESHSGAEVKRIRRKRRRLRKSLQKCGSKSAKRKLKKLSGKETRFARDTNHVVAKAIVKTAECNRLGLAIEQLKGIRSRVKVKRSQRDDLHSWAFFQLGEFLRYNPGLLEWRWSKLTRVTLAGRVRSVGIATNGTAKVKPSFVCQACGYAENADKVAAVNIAARANINSPNAVGNVSKLVYATPQLQTPPF